MTRRLTTVGRLKASKQWAEDQFLEASMEARWCTACGQQFTPRPQAQSQTYCAQASCQRARKRLWQRAKRKSDPDYLANQAQAQSAWSRRNADYWRSYRENHPAYVQRNREKQRQRSSKKKLAPVAKMDASSQSVVPPFGDYRITLLGPDGVAKMDTWIVRLSVLGRTG